MSVSVSAGQISSQSAPRMLAAPSEISRPSEVSGSCTPRPRKESRLSSRIAFGTSSVTKTTTGPRVLGMMCRVRMPALVAPSASAACTNSCRFRLRVWPRTIRAMSSHSVEPMAMKMMTRLRPKNTTIRMTKKMKGSE